MHQEREEFIHNLYQFRIEVVFNSDSILFLLPDGKKCGSDKLLSYGDFTKETLEKYIKYNDTVLDVGVTDPAVMYAAVGLASKILNLDDRQYLQNKYFNKEPLSALEGQAFREAIIKLKNSSHMDWILKANAQEGHGTGNSKQPYLLMSVNELLEIALKEKYHDEMTWQNENSYGNGYDEEQDEYEL